MYAHLVASRQLGYKKYFGVVGLHLMEILDDEPILEALLEKCGHKCELSQESRMTGFSRRMILKGFSNDCLIIFRSSNTANPESYSLEAFCNFGNTPDTELIKEATLLTHHRWLDKKEFAISTSQHSEHNLLKNGYTQSKAIRNLSVFERRV